MKRLIIKLAVWNISLGTISLFLLAAFIDANPMDLNQQYFLALIWMLFTFIIATGIGYNIHVPKQEPIEFPPGSNHVTVGPIFDDLPFEEEEETQN